MELAQACSQGRFSSEKLRTLHRQGGAMTIRHFIGYLLLALMIAAGFYAWWTYVRNSPRNMRRRERRARRERKVLDAQEPGLGDGEAAE
jgi:uncharacterized protein (DUF2062 family)